MARRIVFAVIAIAACKSHSHSVADAILGDWDEWCRTDDEAKSTCPGKETTNVRHTFKADGSLELSLPERHEPPMRGTWKLDGNEITFTFGGGGAALTEKYRARVDGDRLVLWKTDSHFGAVLGRPGASFTAAPTQTSTAGTTAGKLGDVHYTIALPAGYKLARDDNQRQRWQPTGDGLTVELSLGPRAHAVGTEAEPCPPGPPGITGSSNTIDGVEREIDVGTSLCLGPDQMLACSASHTRGYLEPADKDAALALCKSVAVTR